MPVVVVKFLGWGISLFSGSFSWVFSYIVSGGEHFCPYYFGTSLSEVIINTVIDFTELKRTLLSSVSGWAGVLLSRY